MLTSRELLSGAASKKNCVNLIRASVSHIVSFCHSFVSATTLEILALKLVAGRPRPHEWAVVPPSSSNIGGHAEETWGLMLERGLFYHYFSSYVYSSIVF